MCDTETNVELFQVAVLKAGDVVRYYEAPGAIGDPTFLRTDIITTVVSGEYPLHFRHGGPYHPDGHMKKVSPGYSTPQDSEAGSVSSEDMDDDESTGTAVKFRLLRLYKLVYGGEGQACACVLKDSETIKAFGGDWREEPLLVGLEWCAKTCSIIDGNE